MAKRSWLGLCIFHFVVVAMLGALLRSKILFSIPFIDYNRLLDAHHHFAFGAWAGLSLMVLLVYEILPQPVHQRPIYQYLFFAIAILSWVTLLLFPLLQNNLLSDILYTLFIMVTYLFSWIFLIDLRKSMVNRTVFLLSAVGVVCMVLSSLGIFGLAYLFATHSRDPYMYRDALYTYLHFQYNGFFTLSIFAIMLNPFGPELKAEVRNKLYRFAVLLCLSILPSLFLSYLWQDPGPVFWVVASGGGILLFLSLLAFLPTIKYVLQAMKTIPRISRNLFLLSIAAFLLKILLQSLMVFGPIDRAVFGDRPVIIGFLHLVFLVFLTISLFAYFIQIKVLSNNRFSSASLCLLCFFIIANELVLMLQGLGAMFILSSYSFPWMLWITSIGLFLSALLTATAFVRSEKAPSE